ncbi:MAG: hypothetical protein AAGG56_05160 [Pseudomonadota bacterium]
MPSKRELLQKLLMGIETGDPKAADVVNEVRYVQHNPQTAEGGEGLAALFARISKTNPKVRFVRVFEDREFAFAHNEYDFADLKAAFEVFRFEAGKAVEHWDNLQPMAGLNRSGRSMTDGSTTLSDLSSTETNRAIVRDFVETVLVAGQMSRLHEFVSRDLMQHAGDLEDGSTALAGSLLAEETAVSARRYTRLHRVLAEENFVLCQCEGRHAGIHAGLYDLYRVEAGVIVEHWSTVEAIPPRDQWKNDNGKF